MAIATRRCSRFGRAPILEFRRDDGRRRQFKLAADFAPGEAS
jgi:hypothetical protein